MDEPLISVIVPVYNTKKYLKRCFDSIENQTYKKLEIIIVNDGSTDNSKIYCEDFKKKDKRVKIINQTNQGLSSARNSGLDICHGSFVTFIDSDDYVAKDYIEYLINMVKKGNCEIAICAHKEVKDKKTIRDFGKGWSEKKYSPEKCLKAMLNEEGFMVSAWGKLYDKKLFKDTRFPVGKLHEDLGTTYKLIMKAGKIIYGPEAKYYYCQHKNSIINSGFNEKKLDIITQTDKMCDDILKQYPKLIDILIARKIHARFSVLRLLFNEKRLSSKMQSEKNDIKAFILNHKKFIASSSNVPKRTKIATKALSLGEPVFKLSWKLYSRFLK